LHETPCKLPSAVRREWRKKNGLCYISFENSFRRRRALIERIPRSSEISEGDTVKYAFCEYAERRQRVDHIFESIVLEAKGNEDLMRLLDEAGFWQGVANSGVGKFATNLYQAGKQLVQGIGTGAKTGAGVAWSQMTGPATQLDHALTALNKALAAIQKDPQWSQSTTTGASGKLPSMPLVAWLTDTIQELSSQKSQFANKSAPTPAAAAPQSKAAEPAADVVRGDAPSKF